MVMCPNVDFFMFILLGVLWICKWMFFFKIRKFLAIISSDIFSFPLSLFFSFWIAGSYSNFMFNFLKKHKTVSRVAVPFYIPLRMYEVSSFSTYLLTLVFTFIFNHSHPSGYEVVIHCGLVCISLMTDDITTLIFF